MASLLFLAGLLKLESLRNDLHEAQILESLAYLGLCKQIYVAIA